MLLLFIKYIIQPIESIHCLASSTIGLLKLCLKVLFRTNGMNIHGLIGISGSFYANRMLARVWWLQAFKGPK